MILYVMRHGEAVDAREGLKDDWRCLTDKGRSQVETMSKAVAKHGPKARLTLTSPLTRAVQTAEIAARTACRRNVVMASELLLPDADVRALISYLQECRDRKRVMVVGHEPHLGVLVTTLLGLTAGSVSLKKGSCVALELSADDKGNPAEFLWYLVPGKKVVNSLKKAFGRVTGKLSGRDII